MLGAELRRPKVLPHVAGFDADRLAVAESELATVIATEALYRAVSQE